MKFIIILLKNYMFVLILKNLLVIINNKQNLSMIAILNFNIINLLFLSVHVVVFKFFIYIFNVIIGKKH